MTRPKQPGRQLERVVESPLTSRAGCMCVASCQPGIVGRGGRQEAWTDLAPDLELALELALALALLQQEVVLQRDGRLRGQRLDHLLLVGPNGITAPVACPGR